MKKLTFGQRLKYLWKHWHQGRYIDPSLDLIGTAEEIHRAENWRIMAMECTAAYVTGSFRIFGTQSNVDQVLAWRDQAYSLAQRLSVAEELLKERQAIDVLISPPIPESYVPVPEKYEPNPTLLTNIDPTNPKHTAAAGGIDPSTIININSINSKGDQT